MGEDDWERIPIRTKNLDAIKLLMKQNHPEIKSPTDFVDESVIIRLAKYGVKP